jgi:hypothetical protein
MRKIVLTTLLLSLGQITWGQVKEFNKGKNPNGDKQLDLSETELTSLKERVEWI